MSGDNLRLDFAAARSAGGPGAPTLTTPTLTPTTLRNIEQVSHSTTKLTIFGYFIGK
jgi:hypothetical protein